ncbi:MAG: hypothetical protein AAGN82_23910 [Myxococcota bacterium]
MRRSEGAVWAALVATMGFAVAGSACSASTNDDDGIDGAGGDRSGGSGTSDGGNNGIGTLVGGVGGGGAGGGLDGCASETFPGVQVPLDMYVMLDKSASMQSDSKWQNVTTALNTFFADTGSSGIGVGLQFFPVPRTGPGPPPTCDPANDMCGVYGPCLPFLNICSGGVSSDSCDSTDYGTPALPITELPMAAAGLQATMNGETPNGDSTPTGVALAGAREYATAWAAANPTHLTYILFATDGDPTGCAGDAQNEAAQALAATPPVRTFVIGVGPELGFLNGVAQAGGTNQAFLVDSGPNTTQQFLDALADIRNTGACKVQIPLPDQGQPDFDLVNVTLVSAADPNARETVGQVAGASACGTDDGWYYDDPQNPAFIELCPATCDRVRADSLDVEVVLGCETILK